jgi:hypothetical protein
MKFLGNFNMDLDSLKNKNVDTTQPLYANMEAAQNIISGAMGYGKDDGYDVEIIRNDNGTQNMIFKGEQFGPEGWNINSKQLDKIVNADPPGSLLAPATDWQQERKDLTEMSGIFDPNTINENDEYTSLNPDMLSNIMGYEFDETQTTAFNKAKETNPELTQEEFAADAKPPIPGSAVTKDGKPLRKIKWVNGQQNMGGVSYNVKIPVYDYDKEAMYSKISVVADAEMKAAFGINEQGGVDNQGPNEAFNMFNSPEPGLFKNIPEEFKNDPKMKELFTADGKLNWDALDPEKCEYGKSCSAYTTEGTIKPELLKGVRDVYVKNYMDSTVQKHLDTQTAIPPAELLNYTDGQLGFPTTQLHDGVRIIKGSASTVGSKLSGEAKEWTTQELAALMKDKEEGKDEDVPS